MVVMLFVLMFAFMLAAAPAFVSLGLSSMASLAALSNFPLTVITQRLVGGIDRFSLMSIPFFILGANVMKNGGIARRIIECAHVLVGGMKGGLALTTQLACMFFGAVCGSSPATVVAIGGLMHPALKEKQYDDGFAAGLVAASGSVALLIPPSISAIVYGAVTGVSVGALFMAGLGAGILYGTFFLMYCYYYAKKHNVPQDKQSAAAEKWLAAKKASWALGVPIIILGGIYLGIFTPTEASAIATVYAIFVSMVIYKEMNLKMLFKSCVDSAETTAQVMIIIAAASVFGWVLTVGQLPNTLATMIINSNMNKYTFLFIVNIILIICGMFLDGSAFIVIMAPLLAPLAARMEINMIHFGVIFVANAAIGMFTPPIGLNLFVAKSVTGSSMAVIFKGVWPFILVSIFILLILTYIPAVSLFIPRLIYGNI